MGIELQLHSERPGARKRAAGATLLRESHQHGEALAQALATLELDPSGKLCWIDPYGDILFNEQEAQLVRGEAAALAQRCTDERQKAALFDLAALLDECAATPGSYVWCAGD
ncbi:hypothetical protein [Streptomyces sp. H39-S7]|uniref:hypothetical protein n=1 Tax=Streptomyces sp. H39-S7 TaxID=3004357 RepID=UPI0022AF582C|nr:hypothetical protein [Streptomyces sp. H39-S7]MCZ4121339.1 hypothetical protein [Streptomyces sp. H39-S7]